MKVFYTEEDFETEEEYRKFVEKCKNDMGFARKLLIEDIDEWRKETIEDILCQLEDCEIEVVEEEE
ncbi:MAG: hypothetical protein DRP09_12875 [Candidatus Thorarchaeota archaeon]|nr:MAG: hypothetical protein DRP09_12875 [Candidatus Thorarchaeota archaeon]